MKASFEHLGLDIGKNSMRCYWVKDDRFGFYWHYHPEFEITYVHQGQGIRMVGDNLAYFQAGDLIFMGSNLPHTWISDDDFNQSDAMVEVVVLQFSPQLFSEEWLSLPEMKYLSKLIKYADRGINFSPERRQEAGEKIIALTETEGLQRLTGVLELLDLLGQEEQFELLASPSYVAPLNTKTEQRLMVVCQHIHEHFTESIHLEDVAKLANMNVSSFCRFFRKSTGQSLMEYVTDLRIGKACNLLLDDRKYSISEIAHRTGFNSQTLFNRSFLKKMQMTPSTFRKIGN